MSWKSAIALGLLLLAALPVSAGVLVEVDRIREGDLRMTGFELTKGGDVAIEAAGLRAPYSDKLAVYAWILNAETREPVWEMTDSRSSSAKDTRALRAVDKTLPLEKGRYELYFYAGTVWNGVFDLGSKDFFDLIGDMFDSRESDSDDYDYDDLIRDCHVRLSSSDIGVADVKLFDITGDIPGALYQHNRAGDDDYMSQAFEIDEPMNLRIYSIIELPRGYKTAVDNGWIVNAATRERVWEMDRWNTERAGGGNKNRRFDDEIRLDKGSYVLYFSTDDSHSFDDFNVAPPYDPANWGVTLLPGKDFKAAAFRLVDPAAKNGALVELTRIRDNEYVEQAFELKEDMTLQVYALGEWSDSDDEFADYGWIEDVATGKIIWDMTDRNTVHAGGGEKNRMFDGAVVLPKGKYMACYASDDSHSFRDWNVAQPFDAASWGITIYPGPGFKQASFAAMTEDQVASDSKFLARLTRVVDREHRRATFTLDKRTDVSIYAIGEYSSRDREFVDYGWIEDVNGKVVWEMTRHNTVHAGGSEKNRLFDDSVTLEAGEYRVYYITDGSHAFNEWNESRPDDPINWGVTIRLASEG